MEKQSPTNKTDARRLFSLWTRTWQGWGNGELSSHELHATHSKTLERRTGAVMGQNSEVK